MAEKAVEITRVSGTSASQYVVDPYRKLTRITWMTQVCTIAVGNTVATECGRPVSPPHTTVPAIGEHREPERGRLAAAGAGPLGPRLHVLPHLLGDPANPLPAHPVAGFSSSPLPSHDDPEFGYRLISDNLIDRDVTAKRPTSV